MIGTLIGTTSNFTAFSCPRISKTQTCAVTAVTSQIAIVLAELLIAGDAGPSLFAFEGSVLVNLAIKHIADGAVLPKEPFLAFAFA